MNHNPYRMAECWRLRIVLAVLVWVGWSPQTGAADGPMFPVPDTPMVAEFELPDVEGALHRWSDYRGRFVLVNFWATWCAPCRKEMPSLDAGSRQLQGPSFETIGIHVGPDRLDVVRFLEQVPVGFTILIDDNMALSDWGVRGLPTTVLVDPDGRMLYRAVGEKDWASAEMLRFFRGLIEADENAGSHSAQAPSDEGDSG